MERERSDERTKFAAQISLKGDAIASLLKLRKSILPYVKNALLTGILDDRRTGDSI